MNNQRLDLIKKNNIYIILIGSIFLLFLGIVFDNKTNTSLKSTDINVTSFKRGLFRKEAALNTFLDTLASQTKNQSTWNIIREKYPDFRDYLYQMGFGVFIYENDSLVFWSDNTIPVIHKYSGSTFSNKVVFLQNSWYKVLHKTQAEPNRIIIGLILIKRKFQYENEFLKNEFQENFQLPPSVDIKIDSTIKKTEIRDASNNYLFSLVAGQEKTISSSLFLVSILFLVTGFFLLIILFLKVHAIVSKKNKGLIYIGIFALILLLLRLIMIEYKVPFCLYSLDLFDPQFYAQSYLFSSLGDFLLNATFVFFIIYLLYKTKIPVKLINKHKWAKRVFLVFLQLILITFFVITHNLFDSLILNSSIPFDVHKVFDLTIFSFIGFFIIAFLLGAFALLSDKIICIVKDEFTYKYFIFSFLALVLISAPVFYSFGSFIIKIYPVSFLIIIVAVLSYIRYKEMHYSYFLMLLLIFLASVYIVFFVSLTSFEKEKEIRKVHVVNLANERDLVAELLLQEINPKITTDKAVKNYLHYPYTYQKEIHDYLQKEYFKGFWSKYNLRIYVCSTRDSLFNIEPDSKMSHCFTFFGDIIEKYGVPVPKTSFYFLDNINGRINYLGVIKYKIYVTSQRVTLYIELASKLITEELGYPELLLDKKLSKKSGIQEYSYAKYRNTQLLSQTGNYRYNLRSTAYTNGKDEFKFINLDDGYNHLVYNADKNNTIILSRPQYKIVDVFTSLSYIFVFFFIITSIILLFSNFKKGFKKINFSLQNKIQLSMIMLLLLSMFLIGSVIVMYNIRQYNEKNQENIREKIQSVVKELEANIGSEFELTPKQRNYINSVLLKLSDIFNADINLFDIKGNLIGTSRTEIFEKGLVGTRMNMDAYRQLMIYKKAEYIHTESIGKLHFQSAYVPFNNNNGKLLAYLNLPYFTKQTALKKELLSFVAAIINIYVILMLLSIFITVFISNKLTQPLSLIQRKMRETSLGRKNEQIEYKGKDEIGNLVKEYNRMVEELAQSASLLAKSERESAWREMAKQIAHEIKNPLTPMKLSIQYLQRVWKDNKPEKEAVMEKVTRTLIEQIDTLSAIATEFSNFAKMPKAVNEKLNIVQIIKTSVQLFQGTENISIALNLYNHEEIFVYADKEQMLRIFTNLIKNAIHAIPENRKGEINIELVLSEKMATIKVEDNGTGIPDEMKYKIFEPNFTTKTSGMGLGLSIVKSMLENMKGSISFTTELTKGSCFIISLPIFSEDETIENE